MVCKCRWQPDREEDMESKFQFSNPSLVNLSFSINEDFKDEEEVKIKMNIETKTDREPGSSEATVKLSISIGEESDKSPFYVYAEEIARFRWEADAYSEEGVQRLLAQNAPSLLLSYIRPIIASVTSASPFNGYHIPFINFAQKN